MATGSQEGGAGGDPFLPPTCCHFLASPPQHMPVQTSPGVFPQFCMKSEGLSGKPRSGGRWMGQGTEVQAKPSHLSFQTSSQRGFPMW